MTQNEIKGMVFGYGSKYICPNIEAQLQIIKLSLFLEQWTWIVLQQEWTSVGVWGLDSKYVVLSLWELHDKGNGPYLQFLQKKSRQKMASTISSVYSFRFLHLMIYLSFSITLLQLFDFSPKESKNKSFQNKMHVSLLTMVRLLNTMLYIDKLIRFIFIGIF